MDEAAELTGIDIGTVAAEVAGAVVGGVVGGKAGGKTGGIIGAVLGAAVGALAAKGIPDEAVDKVKEAASSATQKLEEAAFKAQPSNDQDILDANSNA